MFAALNSFLTRAVSGYFLNKSLRFRSSASAYLSRTPATATNRTTWTWSAWVKRGSLGVLQPMFSAGTAGTDYTLLDFTTSNELQLTQNTASVNTAYITSSALFRDPAAWYHIVAVWNTASGTATITGTTTDRLQLWVNGVQISSFSSTTVPTQNTTSFINNTVVHYEGLYSTAYFDGEMAEVNFVDGQALAPTSFGAYSIYNQWLPIRYAGTYGTNGFYLPFTNTASTSTLVADSSGNANNWTPNNISLTAGSTYDSLTDVPTLTSTTVANYAVMNPIDPTGSTITDGNLSLSIPFATNSIPKATVGVLSGKWYWETTIIGGGIGGVGILVAGTSESYYPGYTSANGITYVFSGQVYRAGVAIQTYTAFIAGDVIGIALDMDNGKVFFAKNNVWQGSSVPSTGTNPAASTGIAGNTWLAANGNNAAVAATHAINFGQQPFVYTAPSGFLPLNTYNI